MGDILKVFGRVSISFLLVLLYYQDAYAYIDPSAGSFFFQLMLSGIISGLLAIKIFWKNIKSYLSRVAPVFRRRTGNEQRRGGE